MWSGLLGPTAGHVPDQFGQSHRGYDAGLSLQVLAGVSPVHRLIRGSDPGGVVHALHRSRKHVQPDGGSISGRELEVGQGTDGINGWFARGTLAVDGLKPSAVFHELGHSYGLYTAHWGEEYDLFPLLGLGFQNATAFAPEGWLAANGMHGQFLHIPMLKSGEEPYLWDIMGIPDMAWPIPSTFDKFDIGRGLAAPVSTPASKAQPMEAQAVDPREMFFWGVMKADTPGYYHFIPGSFQVFDITGLDASRWDTGTCTHAIPGDPTLTYNLNVLNGQGNMILNLWTDSVPAGYEPALT